MQSLTSALDAQGFKIDYFGGEFSNKQRKIERVSEDMFKISEVAHEIFIMPPNVFAKNFDKVSEKTKINVFGNS